MVIESWKTAGTLKRIIAFLADNIAAFFIFLFLWIPLEIIIPPLIDEKPVTGVPSTAAIIALIVGLFGYLLIKDGVFPGQSLGKKLVGLKTVDYTDKTKPCTMKQSIKRNLPLILIYIIPLIWIAFLYQVAAKKERRRWGDGIANTIVIQP